MTRFRGESLHTLLRLRRQREDAAKHSMAIARGHVAALRRKARALDEALAESTAAARQALLEGDRDKDINWYRRRVETLRTELTRVTNRLIEADSLLTARRNRLAQAIKQRRGIERLRHRHTLAAATRKARRRQASLEEAHAMNEAVTTWPSMRRRVMGVTP